MARPRPRLEAGWRLRSAQLERVSGKSTLAEAIRYALRHWTGLVLFLDDGRLALDTYSIERAIRPIAGVESLCPSSSSSWKHWQLSLRWRMMRTAFARERGNDGVHVE